MRKTNLQEKFINKMSKIVLDYNGLPAIAIYCDIFNCYCMYPFLHNASCDGCPMSGEEGFCKHE